MNASGFPGPRRLEQGERIGGRYRLETRVGSGGMADVWLARDEMLDRSVALKFLHERFAQDEQFVERFRREAQSAAGLQQPNIVGVYDRGEHDGRHYIAMEYVEGATLKDLIGRGLSVGEAIEIVRQILRGARFAHERGIVHRDLKPQNVMVDGEGRARVTDFGIARAGASEITQTGSVMGTAQYLSPEQAQGLEVTSASDLYSIGVILYEALTGRVPFEGDSAVAIALKQVSERPVPPSELNPEVTRALDAVVLRALAKDPENRYRTADEFLRALDSAEADPSGGGLGDTASYAAAAAGAAGGAAGLAAAAAGEPDSAAAGGAGMADGEGDGDGDGWMNRRRAALIALALLLLAGAAAAWALTRPDQVTVPSVIEKDRDEAAAILRSKGFDTSAVERPQCTREGIVTEQDPRAGELADEGSTVTMTVSTGQRVTVPPVTGLSRERARKKLEKAQLLVAEKQRFNDRVKSGDAIGTTPGGGERANCNSQVSLLVSKGENLVMLPDVRGQQQDDAQAKLEGLGFDVVIESRDADQPEGEVIGQSPGPGSNLAFGTQVTLTVSTGAGSVVMPNVEGQSEDAARANLQSLGLEVDTREQTTEDMGEDGRVLEQAPPAGTRLRRGETVTIVVGRFEPPPPEEPPGGGGGGGGGNGTTTDTTTDTGGTGR